MAFFPGRSSMMLSGSFKGSQITPDGIDCVAFCSNCNGHVEVPSPLYVLEVSIGPHTLVLLTRVKGGAQ